MSRVGMGMIRKIRQDFLAETGQDPGRDYAAYVLEQMCDAFVHLMEGAGIEAAVRQQRDVAVYLASEWKGAEKQRLEEALAR